jgi:hypothetical protein
MQPNIPTAAAVEPATAQDLDHEALSRLATALVRCAASAYQSRDLANMTPTPPGRKKTPPRGVETS